MVKKGEIFIVTHNSALIRVVAVHDDRYTVKTHAGRVDVPRDIFDKNRKQGRYRLYM